MTPVRLKPAALGLESSILPLSHCAPIVAGGGSKYLGGDLQLSDIDRMNPQEVDKLYCRCEASMT